MTRLLGIAVLLLMSSPRITCAQVPPPPQPAGDQPHVRPHEPVPLVEAVETETAWWTEPQAGWIGGGLGSLLGLVGGLIGLLVSLGIGRWFTLGLSALVTVLGVFSLLVGVVALALGQPYHVYYPLLLLGFIGSVLFGAGLFILPRRYEQLELRRMTALDA